MTKAFLFAVASLATLAVAPSVRAEDAPLRLVGGCPAIEGLPACPSRHETPPPQDAHPGECYAQVATPPVVETFSQQVLVSPGRVERREIAPRYEWTERRVLVEPARVERHTIPATWRTVTETVVVSAATVRVERSEPVYETVTEQVMVHPVRTEWRRTFVGPDGVMPQGARVQPTGEVICLVEIAAEYRTEQRQVLREPGHVTQIPVPAVTREVTRQVIDQPAHVVEARIPAVYRTEKTRRLVSPGRSDAVRIAPVYATHQGQRETSPGRLEWRRVECDTRQPWHGPSAPPAPADHP